MPKVAKHIFYPLIIALSLISSVLLITRFEAINYVFIPGLILLPLIILFIVLEHFFPFQKKWNNSVGDLSTDLIRTFLILPIAGKLGELLLLVLLYSPLLYLSRVFNGSVLRPEWGIALNAILALLLCEFCYYWIHRLSHKNKHLWRLHAVHHGAERVYWANSGRFHFLDAFLGSVAYFLPIVLLGVSPEVIVLILTLSGVSGILEHVNIDFKAGFLNYIFNTAELHRWHHSEKVNESNRNFGKVLIVWDIVFGSFLWPKKQKIEDVGIENESVPVKFFAQLIYPFKSKKQD
jgi:sterol desaturase/sphingolipid hydroxylase (fatty acid hydroxylase superfamily)